MIKPLVLMACLLCTFLPNIVFSGDEARYEIDASKIHALSVMCNRGYCDIRFKLKVSDAKDFNSLLLANKGKRLILSHRTQIIAADVVSGPNPTGVIYIGKYDRIHDVFDVINTLMTD